MNTTLQTRLSAKTRPSVVMAIACFALLLINGMGCSGPREPTPEPPASEEPPSNQHFFQTSSPEDAILEPWKTHKVTHLTYGNGNWTVVETQKALIKSQPGGQVWAALDSEEEIESFVAKHKEHNFAITDLVYGDSTWGVVMTQGTDYTNQAWAWRASYEAIEQFIEEKQAEGYAVTSLAYGDGGWMAVVSEGRSDQTLVSGSVYEDLRSTIEDSGKIITQIAYGDQRWVAVLGGANWRMDSSMNDQQIRDVNDQQVSDVLDSLQELDDFFEEWRSRGLLLTSLVYADERWWAVMTQGADEGNL